MGTLTRAWQFIVSAFEYLLVHPQAGAVLVGVLAAISITQVVKMAVIQWAPTNGGRGLWYSVQFVIGLAVTWANWRTLGGFSWGLAVGGLLSPGLYTVGTRILFKFVPGAEAKISASPRSG